MKKIFSTASETRVWARKIIDQVIADNVLGPVTCLHAEDLKLVRRILRETVPLAGLSAWEKRILREEWRATLGYPRRYEPKMRVRRTLEARDILPCMRPWAIQHGLIPADEEPTTDTPA